MLHRPAAAGLTAALLLTGPATAQTATAEPTAASPAILAALNVRDASIQELAIETVGATLRVSVELGGRAEELVLWPHSMRSPSYRLLVQQGAGEIVEAQPSPSATYRGVVLGYPESAVAGSFRDGVLGALLRLDPAGDVWTVQPAIELDADAGASDHVVFSSADALPTTGTCGTEPSNFQFHPEAAPGTAAGLASQICEIACDTDVNFYNKNGQSVSATEADIEDVLNGVELIYQSDIDIGYEITTIIVRTVEPDPYTSTNANAMLDEFRDEWLANQGSVHRDIAHLFTGKNIDGGTIGIAWLSQICATNLGYGLSQSRFSLNMDNRVALTAHELGHNWSAPHCDSVPSGCKIMCSGIGGCGSITSFATTSVNKIANYAATKNCLDDPTPPVFPTVNAVVPAQVPALVPGTAEHVSLVGEYLDTVTDVIVDGKSLGSGFPPAYSVQSDSLITIDLPLLDTLGTVDVTLIGVEGNGVTTMEIVPASPPALQLGAGNDPETLVSILPVEFVGAGQPDNVLFLWASFTLAPSAIPFTLTLDIGNGFLDLYLVDFPIVGSAGWVERSYSGINLPPSTTVYFQAFEYDPLTGATPVESTNVSTGFWLF